VSEDDAGDVEVFGLSALCCVMCFSLCVFVVLVVLVVFFDFPFLKKKTAFAFLTAEASMLKLREKASGNDNRNGTQGDLSFYVEVDDYFVFFVFVLVLSEAKKQQLS
jgi:Na+/H+ antiporter NhaD/arsenite permease-like protein